MQINIVIATTAVAWHDHDSDAANGRSVLDAVCYAVQRSTAPFSSPHAVPLSQFHLLSHCN